MGDWSFKLKFGSMGYSLLLLHVLIKGLEIKRNYLPVVIPAISKFSSFPPYYFNPKFIAIFTIDLKRYTGLERWS